jgi:hypothetical protein
MAAPSFVRRDGGGSQEARCGSGGSRRAAAVGGWVGKEARQKLGMLGSGGTRGGGALARKSPGMERR